MKAVAVIPARGGSVRIPRKNVREFRGKPLIAYSVEAALRSGVFDRVVVSTDDKEIAEVAERFGAEVPFVRPPELSDAHTDTSPVIVHAVTQLKEAGYNPEVICCVYATAPFLHVKYLREGCELVRTGQAASAFPVTTFSSPIRRALQINRDGCLEMIWPEHRLTRSQDLPEAYHDAGQFYWTQAAALLREQRLDVQPLRPVALPRYLVHDIDTEEDWVEAELIHEVLEHRGLL